MEQRPYHGIGLMLVATMLLACMDAISKHLAHSFAIPQIMLVRYVIFTMLAVALCRRRGVGNALRSRHPWVQIFRAGILLAEVSIFVLAFRYLPLADVHAVAAAAPVIAVVMAGVFLGERVGLKRWIAVGAAFAGILIIVRPGLVSLEWPAAIPVVGALLWAGYQVIVRWVGARDSAETTVLYTALAGIVVFAILAPFDWRPPTMAEWGWLIVLGALGSTAHVILIRSIQRAPVATVQPFSYALTVWATLLGFLIFDDWPDLWTIAGAAMVIAAGVYSISLATIDEKPKVGG